MDGIHKITSMNTEELRNAAKVGCNWDKVWKLL
jgi:hypothetical protein